MKCLDQYQAFIFDFDGVILDAVCVRTEAFLHVLREYPKEALEEFKAYHLKNGGISRFAKIQYFFNTIIKQPLSQDQEKRILMEFSSFVKPKLYNQQLVIEQTLHFIKKQSALTPLFIASGSEQNELRDLCRFLNITHYFKSILGSPTKKTINVANLIKDFNLDPDVTVLIGDSPNDCISAESNHIHFLGFNNQDIHHLGTGYIHSFEPLRIDLH